MSKKERSIGVLLLALMVPAGIFGLDAVVMPAEYGLASVFFYILSALLFFVPASYIVARFGMRWAGREGGVYWWMTESFGPSWGLWAVWVQWIQQVIWYPTILSYIASTFAFVFFPHETDSQTFIALFCVGTFCVLTLITIMGVDFSLKLTVFAFVVGVLIPGTIFIVLAFIWQNSSSPTLLHVSWRGFFPNRHDFENIALFNAVISGFSGVELCASYAHRVRRPEKTYSWAILIATILALAVLILGSLALLMMLPIKNVTFTYAVIHAINITLAHFHLSWMSWYLGVLIVLGGFAIVLIWILGPLLGFHVSAEHHRLPQWFAKKNRKGAPVNLLIVQAIIVCAFSLVFYFSSSVNDAFWILTALSTQVYFLMYLVLFIAAFIKLKRTKFLMACVVLGVIGCAFTVITPFDPPRDLLQHMSVLHYELFISVGLVVCCILPWIWTYFFKPQEYRDESKTL